MRRHKLDVWNFSDWGVTRMDTVRKIKFRCININFKEDKIKQINKHRKQITHKEKLWRIEMKTASLLRCRAHSVCRLVVWGYVTEYRHTTVLKFCVIRKSRGNKIVSFKSLSWCVFTAWHRKMKLNLRSAKNEGPLRLNYRRLRDSNKNWFEKFDKFTCFLN